MVREPAGRGSAGHAGNPARDLDDGGRDRRAALLRQPRSSSRLRPRTSIREKSGAPRGQQQQRESVEADTPHTSSPGRRQRSSRGRKVRNDWPCPWESEAAPASAGYLEFLTRWRTATAVAPSAAGSSVRTRCPGVFAGHVHRVRFAVRRARLAGNHFFAHTLHHAPKSSRYRTTGNDETSASSAASRRSVRRSTAGHRRAELCRCRA